MSTALNNTYLASGGTLALAFGTSPTRIFGSVDADKVTIAAGVVAVLDGSFNRGNDTIVFTGNAASYSIVRVNASTVRVTDASGTSVTIPVGSAGTKIEFADAARTLSGSSAGILLGDQTVTATAASVAAGTAVTESYVLSVDNTSVTEGDSGTKTLSYKITLDKAPTKDVTISYETLDIGTAKSNDDFVPAVGTITIPAGQRSAIVSITVLGDTVVETSETVVLRLTGSSLVAAVNATGTIIDNDLANLPASYTLSGSNAVNEGSAATFALKTTGLAAGTTVAYKVTGTGSAAAQSANGTFTVDSDGNATVSIPVSANNTIGDTGALTIELLNGKATPVTATVIDGTPTTYSAPAITTTNAGSGVQTINVAGTAAQSITLDTDQVTANNGFVINSTSAAVTVTSGSSNDKITLTGNANNTIVTGAGNDTVTISGAGNNTIRVGSGNDTVTGGSGNDTIYVDAGNLGANDVIDGGAGNDTLVIAGNGNVITSANVKNIENIVLDGTTVTVQDIAALANVKSISGSTTTSDVTVNVAAGDVVDLTGLALTTIKNLTLAGTGTITLKVDAADLTNSAAILVSGGATVNLVTDVAGLKALSGSDTGVNGTKAVVDTVANLIANKSALSGASTVTVAGTVGLADAAALASAGVAAAKTVSMSVAALLDAAKYPDQLAALTSAGTKIQVTGTATAAQATSLLSSYGNQIAAYQAAAVGNLGVSISDTAANIVANFAAANDAKVSSVSFVAGAGVSVANAATLAGLSATKVTGTYSVADSASAINAAITSNTLPASLAKASSVSLTAGARTVTSTADALELQLLGAKLTGGYDLSLTAISGALTNNDLAAIAGATKVSLAKASSGTFSVSELNIVLAQNAATLVNKVSDTATNLAGVASKLTAVTADVTVTSAATVAEATALNTAIAGIVARGGSAQGGGVNVYSIADTKANVLAGGSATAVRGAEGVTVSDAMTLTEAQSLQTTANLTGDRLTAAGLAYTISDSASTLATALSAANNTAAVAALAGANANGVVATGNATVAEAKVLGAQYNSAVQVDAYKIADTVAKLFSSGSTLNSDIDATTDAALAKATSLSVIGNVTVAQLGALKGVQNAASTAIFDNKYAITDSAASVAGATTADMVAASSITLNSAAAAANLANLKTLNDALAAAGKAVVSFALTDTIANLTGNTALGGSASVVAFAKTASSITATGTATTITLAALDDLATKAGSSAYSVRLTDTASAIAGLSAGVLGSSVVTSLVVSDATLTAADAKSMITTIGASAAAKLTYSLVDTYANLTAASNASTVLNAVNLTATDNLTAAKAATLVGLTGAAGTVTYNLVDTYANLVAQSASIADGASTIDVSDASLNVARYTELLRIAGLTTTVTTSVAAEAIVDSAANVSAASAAVLTATSGVTLTDNGSLTFSLAQARALTNAGNNGYDVTTTPAGATVQVKIVDTTANLIAAQAANTATNNYVLGAGSYKVIASDTANLSVAQATTLLLISDLSANFTLTDTSANLAGYANLAKASSVTATDATALADATTIFTANKNASFIEVTGTAAAIGASTGTGSSKVFTNAAVLAKAAAVTVSAAASLADIAEAKAAAGSVAVKYSLTDTAANYAKASVADLSGATTIAVTGAAAKGSEAAVLAAYTGKMTASILVSDTAANLVANVEAIKAVSTITPASGTVSVSSGTISASQYATLQNTLKTVFAGTTVTDSATALADFLSAGNTAAGYAFTTKLVNASQASVILANATAATAANGTLQIQDTAANLLALNTGQAAYRATDTVELSIAKDLQTKFGSAASFSIATTADRFNSAYTFDTDASSGGTQLDTTALTAMQRATSLTVDGVTVKLGSKDPSLTAGNQTLYNGKIIGTVAEINALPASIKAAAGYVIVDSVANVTNAANAGLVAASVGYVITDTAANILAASSSVLSSGQKALGIQVSGVSSVADINAILAKTDTDTVNSVNAVKYSLSDTATALAAATSVVSGATNVTVTGTANATQATAILGANSAAVVNAVDTGVNLAAMSNGNIAKLASIVADANTATAGTIDPITLAQADTLVRNKGANATLTFNVDAVAGDIAAAVGNVTGTGADLTTLRAAGVITVTGGAAGTAATAAQAKALAAVTITGGYAVSDSPANLTTSTTVGLVDLAKATVVKANGAATVAQAITLTGLTNFEKGAANTADAGKNILSISDSALNIAKSGSAGLFDGLSSASTVTVDYTAALTAAQATTLAALDAASTKLSTTPASVKVTDTSANLLAADNASAIAAVGTINVTDVMSVATLNQVRTAGGTANSEVYSYKLADSAAALIVAGTATVDGATSVKVTGTTSYGDMAIIEARAATTGTVVTATSYEKVVGTISELSGGTDANSNGINDTVENKADLFSLTGSASLSQVNALLSDSNFDKVYSIADTAANLVNAINQDGSLAVLNGAVAVGLASGQTANAAQATMINANLGNEAKLALADTAANFNLAANASAVAAAASVVVSTSANNDGLSAGITAAKITYSFGSLANMELDNTGGKLDVINGKTGDVIDLTGIADWDAGAGSLASLVIDSGNDGLLAGEYLAVRGYYSASDGTFTASASGTDTQLLIGTDATAGADETIIILGVTSLIPNATAGNDVNTFTFG